MVEDRRTVGTIQFEEEEGFCLAGYLLELAEEISPLLNVPSKRYEPMATQMFTLMLTPTAILVLDGEAGPYDSLFDEEVSCIEISGFTSSSTHTGSKAVRLTAQMAHVCELLSMRQKRKVELQQIGSKLTTSK